MGAWWQTAETASAVEFGRNHYRGIMWLRVLRAAAPFVALGLVLAAAGYAVWRWVLPALADAGKGAAAAAPTVGSGLVIAVVIAVVALAGVLAWRRWGLELEARFNLTGRGAAVAVMALLALGGLATVALWPS